MSTAAPSKTLIGALLVAAAVRLALARYSLWFDELASVFFASQPLRLLWSGWMMRETNPPLYYSLLGFWTHLVGLGTVRLRSFSIIVSLVAMIVTYRGVRMAYGNRGAAIAVVMMALSAQQLIVAQQVRAYMMLYLAVTVSFFGLLRLTHAVESGTGHRPGGWIAYVGGSIAAIYLHTTGLLWPAVGTLALMIAVPAFRPFAGRSWRSLVMADALILLAASWWIAITCYQARDTAGDLGWMHSASVGQMIWTVRSTILLTRDVTAWQQVAPLTVAALALLGTVLTWRRATTRLAAACLVIGVGLFVSLSLFRPILTDRTVLWLSIFPLTLAAAGIGAIRTPRIAGGLVAAITMLLSVNLYRSSFDLQNEDWSGPVAHLAQDPTAVVLVNGEAMSVALDMDCMVELARRPCPFPVVAVVGQRPDYSPWARGYARPVGAIGADARLYLYSRRSRELLIDLHHVGLIDAKTVDGALLAGPMPGGFGAALAGRSHLDHGLLRLDTR